MSFNKVFKRVILFGAIILIIVSVFLIAKSANEKEEGIVDKDNGTTSPVNTAPSEDDGKDIEPPVEDDKQEDSREKEQKDSPQKDTEESVDKPEEDRPRV